MVKSGTTSIILPTSHDPQRYSSARLFYRRIQQAQAKMVILVLAAVLMLTACQSSGPSTPLEPTLSPDRPATSTSAPSQPSVQPSPSLAALELSVTPTPAVATPDPGSWMEAQVIPQVSDRARQIFELGSTLGNDPHRFSKIGDSETFTSWFLAPFDQTPPTYRLGDYAYLDGVISHFAGSFARQSLAARQGFNASSVFAPLWADPNVCLPGETPIACEFRHHRPSYVFVLLGTNDIHHIEDFEPQMRRIIEFSIEGGILPILGTKADNLEGDGYINRTLFELAWEYEIPLWNFWGAVQHLPQSGLDEDQAHLTFGNNYFDDPEALLNAWPVRNLTALQTLDAVWRATQP